MELKKLEYDFSVCKVNEITQMDLSKEFVFVGKTDEELSLVCLTKNIPKHVVEREDGWRGFRIQGELDFTLIGILAPIASLLAENQIGIFVVSTYNTDYVFVKQDAFKKAMMLLEDAGYTII